MARNDIASDALTNLSEDDTSSKSKTDAGRAGTLRLIQKGLRSAGQSTNRQALAARIGISTRRIQAILAGEVPDAGTVHSQKLIKGWTRSLVRVAKFLDLDPANAIALLGISWDPEMLRLGTDKGQPTDPEQTEPLIDDIIDSIHRCGGRVHVWRGVYPPFHYADSAKTPSFYSQYAHLLIAGVDHNWTIEPDKNVTDIEELTQTVDDLLSNPDEAHLIMGLFQIPDRETEGVSFLKLGFRTTLAALYTYPKQASANARPKVPIWHDIVHPREPRGFRVAASLGESGEIFLTGSLLYQNQIEKLEELEPEKVAGVLVRLFHNSRTPVIYVADGELCRSISSVLRHSDAIEVEHVQVGERELSESPPRFDLAIGFRGVNAPEWGRRLRRSQEGLFTVRAGQMAAIYAELIQNGRINEQRAPRAVKRAVWRPIHIHLFGTVFRRLLCWRLCNILQAENLPWEDWEMELNEMLPRHPAWRRSIRSVVRIAGGRESSQTSSRLEQVEHICTRAERLLGELKELRDELHHERLK